MPDRDELRPRWVGTSWKMNMTLAAADAWVGTVAAAAVPPDVRIFVLPPATALDRVRRALPAGSPILVGAQNAHWRPDGAVTGEVSMTMVRDAGADLVAIGHSERRQGFGETDRVVAAKVAAAAGAGLVPLVCVGEPESVRAAGEAERFVAAQVRSALSELAPASVPGVLIAYEPVWAIGEHGRAAAPEQIEPVLAAAVSAVRDLTRGGSARALLYGGSASPVNAGPLLEIPCLDGLFVGRAGLDPDRFLELVDRCRAAPVGNG